MCAINSMRIVCWVCLPLACTLASAVEERGDPADGRAGPLKDIHLGPGKLDIGGSFRLRYEHLDEFSIKGYGNRRDGDLLLSRLRLDFDYRLDEDLHAFLQLQDARHTLSHLELRDFGDTSGPVRSYTTTGAAVTTRIGHSSRPCSPSKPNWRWLLAFQRR